MMKLVSNAAGAGHLAPNPTTSAAISAADAALRGASSHAEATWKYLTAILRIECQEARKCEDRLFGAAFRDAYAAKSSASNNGRDAAKMALCRVRALARGITAACGDSWAELVKGPADVLAFAPAKRRQSAGKRTNAQTEVVAGVLSSLLQGLSNSETEVRFKTAGAKHRYQATTQAAASLLARMIRAQSKSRH